MQTSVTPGAVLALVGIISLLFLRLLALNRRLAARPQTLVLFAVTAAFFSLCGVLVHAGSAADSAPAEDRTVVAGRWNTPAVCARLMSGGYTSSWRHFKRIPKSWRSSRPSRWSRSKARQTRCDQFSHLWMTGIWKIH